MEKKIGLNRTTRCERFISILILMSCVAACSPPKNPKSSGADESPSTGTPPTSSALTVGALSHSIASDGTSAVIVTLRNADGSLNTASDIRVTFSSPCASQGKADLDASVVAVDGLATATYLPHGCNGTDTVSVAVTLGQQTFSGSTDILVGAATALSARAALGKQMFFDKALSASGQQSCASCHSPANSYYAPDKLVVPLGGRTMTASGFRSSPSASYAAIIPPFGFLTATNQQGSVDNLANGKFGTPRRGLMWDGRATDVQAQASGPFTGPHEMGNANTGEVLTRLLTRPYLTQFKAVFGNTTASSNADSVVSNMADAIASYETENASFTLFTSKYDFVIRGFATFTAQELNGQALFNNPQKGACLGCHDSTGQSIADPQLFTDLSYRAIGVPRNWAIPYNNDSQTVAALQSLGLSSLQNGAGLGSPNHRYYDMGFCGPFRTDSLTETALCGAFRVAPLRNVALKGSYFHNGVFKSLNEVINFYMNRDIAPSQIYKKADGTSDIPYNDLPFIYQVNIDKTRNPFRSLGSGVRLTPSEIQDLITFICTLTDGYDPNHPEAYRQPLQCRSAQR